MSESEYGKFRAAVFDAIANAKARAPHENVKFGMTKEVEVGRSDPNKQPRLVLYATQKSADGVFQVDIETLKTQLEKGDLGKGPDLTENVKKLFTFHFEPGKRGLGYFVNNLTIAYNFKVMVGDYTY